MGMTDSKHYINLNRLLYTAVVNMIYLSFVNACRTIQYTVLTEAGMPPIIGFLQMEIAFLFGPIFLVYMGPLIHKFYFRFIFYFSCFGIFLCQGPILIILIREDGQQDPAILQSLLILLSLIAAPFNSVYYCAYNFYLDKMASKGNKSFYFGVGWSSFCASNFIAAVYGKYLYPEFQSPTIYYLVILLTGFIVSNLYWFMREAHITRQSQSIGSLDMIQQEISEHTKSDTEQQVQKKQKKINTSLKEVYKIMRVEYFVFIAPNLILIGMLQGFSGTYSQKLCQIGPSVEEYTNLFNLSMYDGIGEVLGGMLSGLIGDSYGQLSLLFINQYLIIFSCVFLTIGVMAGSSSIINIYALLFGFAIASQITTTYSFIATRYQKQPQVFVLIGQLYCFGYGFSGLIYYLVQNLTLYYGVGYVLLFTCLNIFFINKYQTKIEDLKTDHSLSINE